MTIQQASGTPYGLIHAPGPGGLKNVFSYGNVFDHGGSIRILTHLYGKHAY